MHSLVFLMLITITVAAPHLLLHISAPTSASQHLTPEIVRELKDFLQLIPEATVDEIIAKHYIIDGDFRKAISFLRSSQFTELLRNVQRIPDIIEILEFLQLENNIDGRNINALTPLKLRAAFELNTYERWQQQLANVIDNLPLQIELLPDSAAVGNLRSFSSFVEEIIEHLPHDKYIEMINEKRQRSAPFAAFYVALRSTQFEVLVDAALKSPNLVQTLHTLSSHEIYATSLKPIAFKVISWGPSTKEN